APYDWRGFLEARVYRVNPRAPLGGIEASGWKLVYTDVPNELTKAAEQARKFAEFSSSLGLRLGEGGSVADVVPGSAAEKAGMSPGGKVIAVDGRKYSAEGLHAV